MSSSRKTPFIAVIDDDGDVQYLNVINIVRFYGAGTGTTIEMINNNDIYAKETVDMIREMLEEA